MNTLLLADNDIAMFTETLYRQLDAFQMFVYVVCFCFGGWYIVAAAALQFGVLYISSIQQWSRIICRFISTIAASIIHTDAIQIAISQRRRRRTAAANWRQCVDAGNFLNRIAGCQTIGCFDGAADGMDECRNQNLCVHMRAENTYTSFVCSSRSSGDRFKLPLWLASYSQMMTVASRATAK